MPTLDEFGGRKFVIPAEVRGPLRKARSRVYFILLLIFVGLPWIKINGLQAVLLDIPQRHFEIFGQLFLAHDTPLIFLLLGGLIFTLAFVTAVWGRVWCGWACPQTVFIDAVYRKIEIWIEGEYLARRKLRTAPMTLNKLTKLILKWIAFLLVSSAIAHSLIAYFAGADRLIKMIQGTPAENWSYFLIVSTVTAALMFNFGWFREQFCIIMCPYGRFQSVLMDAGSVSVAYDEKRGEPRKGSFALPAKVGDCVSCNRCVQVCPTDIDIRNGVQMECIACTACIDACNEIMKKVNKAPDLIAYRNFAGKSLDIARPRVLALMGMAAVCFISLAIAMTHRTGFAVNILRATDSPYQILPNDMILNHFKMHVFNQSQAQEEFEIIIPTEISDRGVKLTQNQSSIVVNSGASAELQFFLIFPRKILNASGDVALELTLNELRNHLATSQKLTLLGP